MKALAIIPARFGSSRLEGKPLVDILGKPMIQRVYEQAAKAISTVFVATDDVRIKQTVIEFGGNVVMTSADHQNGTTRCLEAYEKISAAMSETYDVVINVQGDEPMLDPSQLTDLLVPFKNEKTRMSTLVTPVINPEDLMNESEAFVILDKDFRAMYFSRSVIPHVRGLNKAHWMEYHTFYKHVGLYAYTYEALKNFAELPVSSLERMESLEQNRWIENGNEIYVAITLCDSIPVDTLEDLERVRAILRDKAEEEGH